MTQLTLTEAFRQTLDTLDLIAEEFDITPETQELVWFVVEEPSAARSIKKKFGKVIKECGNALGVPGKYWSLIENLAYTSGGKAIQVPMPKKCAEKTALTINKKPIKVDTVAKTITYEEVELDDDIGPEQPGGDATVLTSKFNQELDKINDAGAGVQAHTQIDNTVQNAFAAKKPIQNVPSP